MWQTESYISGHLIWNLLNVLDNFIFLQASSWQNTKSTHQARKILELSNVIHKFYVKWPLM